MPENETPKNAVETENAINQEDLNKETETFAESKTKINANESIRPSFSELMKDKEFKAEYDRAVQKGIDSDAKKHGGSLSETKVNTSQEELDDTKKPLIENFQQQIDERVQEEVNIIRFENCLGRILNKSGIEDTQGYLAHIDIDDLIKHYNPETDRIDGYEELEAEMREEFPHYFKTQATGGAHGTFEKNSNATLSLKSALNEAYSKNK